MDQNNSECMKKTITNLSFLFVGNHSRGKRLQEAVELHGWKITMKAMVSLATRTGSDYTPDLVILDGFPESEIARSAYYQYHHCNEVLFLALNDSPGNVEFLHVNALSFIKIINRDPDPKELANAIYDLVQSNRKSTSQYTKAIGFGRNLYRCMLNNLGNVQGKSCC